MLVQVGVAVVVVVVLLQPELVAGRHRPELLHRPLLPLHLHGVQLLKHGIPLREQLRRLHGIQVPLGWYVFDYPQIPFYLSYHYRVLLPLLQHLPQESMEPLLFLLLLRLSVKHQRTMLLVVLAVLLLPLEQCYPATTRLLPKMRVVSDIYFQDLFLI